MDIKRNKRNHSERESSNSYFDSDRSIKDTPVDSGKSVCFLHIKIMKELKSSSKSGNNNVNEHGVTDSLLEVLGNI